MPVKVKILVTEDEPDVASFISKSLDEQGYETFIAYDGETGLRLAENKKPDLVIADIIMPVKNGLQFCRELRTAGNEVPVIMLTALGSTQDIVAGLDAGADDYLPKPFELPELLARVRALLRRKECMDDISIIEIDDMVIDFRKKQVSRAKKNIELTAKEFRLLEFLAKNRGKVKSRADILQEVWGFGFDPGTNLVDVYINYLRNKIDKPFNKKLFYTRAGQGYLLQD
jgi:DNA-binding response OmpR family regulator